MENNVSSRPGERLTPALSSLCISSPQKCHHGAYPAPSPTKSCVTYRPVSFHTPVTRLMGRLISTKLEVDFFMFFK